MGWQKLVRLTLGRNDEYLWWQVAEIQLRHLHDPLSHADLNAHPGAGCGPAPAFYEPRGVGNSRPGVRGLAPKTVGRKEIPCNYPVRGEFVNHAAIGIGFAVARRSEHRFEDRLECVLLLQRPTPWLG
jgi:hypothetical protein